MSEVEDPRLTAVSQETLAAVDRVGAGTEAEASGFRQEIERQRNMADVRLQPRVVLHRIGDHHLLMIKAEDPPELTTSLDQENPESRHIKDEKEELSTTPEFPITSVHVKSEDEEEKPQFLQPHQIQTEAEPPSSSSAEQIEVKIEAGGDDCGGSEPARNSDQPEDLQPDTDDEVSESSSEAEDSDDDWRETRAFDDGLNSEAAPVSDEECKTGDQHLLTIKAEDPPELTSSLDQENPESRHIKEEEEELLTTPEFPITSVHVKSEDEEEKPQFLQPHQRQTEAEPPSSSSAGQIEVEIEADGDDCGGSEPARNSGKKSHRCSECGKTFHKPSALKRHMTIHTGEKPFVCATCGKKFRLTSNLNEHKRLHTGEKPFECVTCGKRFRHKRCLKEHERFHTGEKPHNCATCGKKFRHKRSLNEHIRLHTGEKPFQCATCGKKFHLKSCLKEHVRLHTGEKPYECATCGKNFRHKRSLNDHIRLHTGVHSLICNVCGRTFSKAWTLRRHMKSH